MESLIPKYSATTVWCMALNATWGSFIFGYNIGVMTSLEDSLSYYFDWGDNKDVLFTYFFAVMYLGATVGALMAGTISDQFGRRRALMIYDLSTILGCLLAVIPWIPFFPIGRIICGFGVGGFVSIVPNYLKEISPDDMFGRTASLIQLQLTSGIVVSYSLALALPTSDVGDSKLKDYWIVVYGFQGLIALLQACVFLFVYKNDTSHWLFMKKEKEKAIIALNEIYAESESHAILARMDKPDDPTELKNEDVADLGYSKLLCCKSGTGRMMRMGCLLSAIQQFVGINAIFGYLAEIFEEINDDTFIARVLTLIGGIVYMLVTIIVFPLVGRFGRKTLLITSCLGVGFSMIGAALFSGPFEDVGTLPSIILILLYLVSFNIGVGPMCWVYLGDIMSSKGISICTGVNMFSAFAIVLVYPYVLEAFGLSVALGVYGVFAFLSGLYIYCDLFETKELTPEEIKSKLRIKVK